MIEKSPERSSIVHSTIWSLALAEVTLNMPVKASTQHRLEISLDK
jgi:hypothetical protein